MDGLDFEYFCMGWPVGTKRFVEGLNIFVILAKEEDFWKASLGHGCEDISAAIKRQPTDVTLLLFLLFQAVSIAGINSDRSFRQQQ